MARELPETLKSISDRYWHQFEQSCFQKGVAQSELTEELMSTLKPMMAISDFASHTFIHDPEWTILCQKKNFPALVPAEIQKKLSDLLPEQDSIDQAKRKIRLFRNQMMCLIMARFFLGKSSLSTHLYELSLVADLLIIASVQFLQKNMQTNIGLPESKDGKPIFFSVIALGKLGGEELNFSSDIDLIFCYSAKGHVKDSPQISVEQYFTRLGQNLIDFLSEMTEEGFVYRVDMRLRPYGNSGALVMHFDQLEQYYQYHGRDWERYALLKARMVFGSSSSQNRLNQIIQPFVFKKYLDYSAFDALRDMKAKISLDNIKQKRQNDIKLGDGGIRQIEFYVQALQLIRGGKNPSLQKHHFLSALAALREIHAIEETLYTDLKSAYLFFREFEHYLQFIRDEQTHNLPTHHLDRERLTYAMQEDSWEGLYEKILHNRNLVYKYFNSLSEVSFANRTGHSNQLFDAKALWTNVQDKEYEQKNISKQFLDQLRLFKTSAAVRGLKEKAGKRLNCLMPVVIEKVLGFKNPEKILARSIKFLSAILRRSAYFTFLMEKEEALTFLLKALDKSEWICDQLCLYPVLLDDILLPISPQDIQDAKFWQQSLNQELNELGDDLEQQMEKLRQFKQSAFLNVALLEIFEPNLVNVPLALNFVVQAILEKVYELGLLFISKQVECPSNIADLKATFPFAIIAYGKLGARSFSYTSDLDLVFLYQESTETEKVWNKDIFVRLAQRIIHILSTPMLSGRLFEVDVRLRPGGSAGVLVNSVIGYEKYLADKAWTFEIQALVNARFIIGPQLIEQSFVEIRHQSLSRERESVKLKNTVCKMRNKMLSNLASQHDQIKVTEGGMVDIEFISQYGVLLMAHRQPKLTTEYGVPNIMKALCDCEFLSQSQTQILHEAYNYYLKLQRLTLLQTDELVNDKLLKHMQQKVSRIWDRFFKSKAIEN